MKPNQFTDWQKIMLLSKSNGTENHQELLPNHGWTRPKQTWLSKRLDEIRKEQSHENDLD